MVFEWQCQKEGHFLKIASSHRDDQQLLSLLIETDSAGDLSESAQAIKEGGKTKTVPKFCATRWTATYQPY